MGAILPASRRVVDTRPITESIAYGLTGYFVPILWYRLTRQFEDLMAELRVRQGGAPGNQRAIVVMSLLSAVISFAYYRLLLPFRDWSARRLARKGIRSLAFGRWCRHCSKPVHLRPFHGCPRFPCRHATNCGNCQGDYQLNFPIANIFWYGRRPVVTQPHCAEVR